MTKVLVGCLCLWCAFNAWAADVAGVHVEERVTVGGSDLVLNGAGLRTRLFFKVYVAGLYLPRKMEGAAGILGTNGPRRMVLVMLRDVDGDTLLKAMNDGLRDNNSDLELAPLQPAIAQFAKVFQSVGNTKSGDRIVLDFSTGGMSVSINGSQRGQVADEAFGRALLKVWLGEKPVELSLKNALSGN